MDILDFAINMEIEGERFYRELADENRGNSLYPVFLSLAEDELRHARILAEKKTGKEAALGESALTGGDGIFKDKKQFKEDIKAKPGQLNAYRKALDKEQESISLYSKLLSESVSIYETDLFGYLVEQERLHFNTLEDIVYLLERAESWVESPEFGIRKDY